MLQNSAFYNYVSWEWRTSVFVSTHNKNNFWKCNISHEWEVLSIRQVSGVERGRRRAGLASTVLDTKKPSRKCGTTYVPKGRGLLFLHHPIYALSPSN